MEFALDLALQLLGPIPLAALVAAGFTLILITLPIDLGGR